LDFEEGVFLFNSVPGFLLFGGVEDLFSEMSEVSVCWLLLGEVLISPDPGLAHDDDVVTFSKRVSAVEDWLQDNLGVVGGGLIG
jgi:hypothetical protein